jgi:hypothetical protein
MDPSSSSAHITITDVPLLGKEPLPCIVSRSSTEYDRWDLRKLSQQRE